MEIQFTYDNDKVNQLNLCYNVIRILNLQIPRKSLICFKSSNVLHFEPWNG